MLKSNFPDSCLRLNGAVYRTAPIPPLKLAQFLPEAAKIQLEQLSKLFTITPECMLG